MATTNDDKSAELLQSKVEELMWEGETERFSRKLLLCLSGLEQHGATVDVNRVYRATFADDVLDSYDWFEAHGVKVDYDELYGEMCYAESMDGLRYRILRYLPILAGHQVAIDYREVYDVVSNDYYESATKLLDDVVAEIFRMHGVEVDYQAMADKLVADGCAKAIVKYYDELKRHGATVDYWALREAVWRNRWNREELDFWCENESWFDQLKEKQSDECDDGNDC